MRERERGEEGKTERERVEGRNVRQRDRQNERGKK